MSPRLSLAASRRRRVAALGMLLIGIVGCDSGTEPPVEQISTTLTVLSTGDRADTILAGPDTLWVLLSDQNGHPIAERAVGFTVLDTGRLALVNELDHTQQRVLRTSATTGPTGIARVIVHRHTLTGEGRVVLQNGLLRDTAHYTTLPGAPFSVVVEPTHKGLYVGNSYDLAAVALDRFDNVASTPAVLTLATPGIVSLENETVTALEYGYGVVVAQTGTLTDTAWVAVVPRGTIAGHGIGPGVVTINLDGSDLQEAPICPGTVSSGGVRWSPSGTLVAYHASEAAPGLQGLIHLVEMGGTCRRLSAISDSHWDPTFSPDEEWIYLRVFVHDDKSEIWRMRLDGSDLARIGPEATGFVRDAWPGVSPDGSRLSFWTTRAPGGLAMMDLATRAVHINDRDGQAPRWSPTGQLIAYRVDGVLVVANPDLTNERTFELNSMPLGLDAYYDWSPDGEWLITSNGAGATARLVLVRVDDGLTIPLDYMGALIWPAWRP